MFAKLHLARWTHLRWNFTLKEPSLIVKQTKLLNTLIKIKPKEGGVRVCGDAVLLDFWCGFAVIFILSCGIAVLQNQAVCGN